MTPRLRAAAALLVVAGAATSGLVAVGGAQAAVPGGGCWTYVPDPVDPALDADPASDLSVALEPWSVDETQILLGNSGATATGGTRDLVVGVSAGPVVSDLAATGTAYVVLSVDGVPLDAPLSTPFTATPGTPVSDVVVRGSVPVGAAGQHTVRVDSVYFDVPAQTRRVACNAQTSGEPGGPNPATDPVPTDIVGDWVTVASSAAAITRVSGQRVTTAGRAGDVVRVHATGLASSAAAGYELCYADVCQGAVDSAWVEQDGSTTFDVPIPGGADPGAATIAVDDGTTRVQSRLTILGAPSISASEKVNESSTTVTVTGTDWDPRKAVTIGGYAGSDTSAARTDDPAVQVEVGADGTFTATFEVTDPATETIGVTQGSTLVAGYEFSGQVGTTPTDGTDTGGTDTGSDGTDTGGTVVPPAAEPGAVDPGDIPEPDDIPIKTDPGESPVTPEQVEDLAVSEAHLDGHADLAELFGGAPRRDLVFLVENVGDSTVDNPIVRVAVGRSEELEPEVVDVAVGTLGPGDQTVVTVPLELPMAAFGTYRVVGQVGDSDGGAFELEWTTYPWGLFALNLLAAALLVWGLRHRLAARRPAPYRPVPVVAGGDEAVVDLAAAEAWWTYRARGGVPAGPAAAASSTVVDDAFGEAVVDLEAAEKWWARRGGGKGSQAS